MKLTKATFNEVLQHADDIFASNPAVVQSVSAVSVSQALVDLDETQPAIPYASAEVAAVSRGRGGRGGRGFRNNRGGRGRGGGQQAPQNQASSGPKHKGTKHPDLPQGEWKGCSMHFKWGRGAYFCSEPSSCPWKNVYAEKPAK